MQESIVFLLHVQCHRKESSRSLPHLLMSFLLFAVYLDDLSKTYSLANDCSIILYADDILLLSLRVARMPVNVTHNNRLYSRAVVDCHACEQETPSSDFQHWNRLHTDLQYQHCHIQLTLVPDTGKLPLSTYCCASSMLIMATNQILQQQH